MGKRLSAYENSEAALKSQIGAVVSATDTLIRKAKEKIDAESKLQEMLSVDIEKDTKKSLWNCPEELQKQKQFYYDSINDAFQNISRYYQMDLKEKYDG